MAAKDMDTRQKMGPLAGQWKTINDRNPLLKNRGIDTAGIVAHPVAVVVTLDKMVDASNDAVVGHGGLWNQMDRIAKQKRQAITKVRDDYRSQITSIDKSIDDLEKRCDTLESEMRGLITKYQAQARLDHKKVGDDMDAFKTVLDGP
jgi:hypothetical protein